MPVHLGLHSYIHRNDYTNTFDGNVLVGDYTSIARNATFLCGVGATHPTTLNRKAVANWDFKVPTPTADITIGSDVWIGTNVTILPCRIGDGAIIGAGTVVTKDVPPYAVVVGSPPVIKRYRFSPEVIEKMLQLAWWTWPDEKVQEARQYFHDIDLFLEKYAK